MKSYYPYDLPLGKAWPKENFLETFQPIKYELLKKDLPEPIKPLPKLELRPYVGRDRDRRDMGTTLFDNQPSILREQEFRRAEMDRIQFRESRIRDENYKTNGVPPLEPINPNRRYEPVQFAQPRNPAVDYRQFDAMADMKYKF